MLKGNAEKTVHLHGLPRDTLDLDAIVFAFWIFNFATKQVFTVTRRAKRPWHSHPMPFRPIRTLLPNWPLIPNTGPLAQQLPLALLPKVTREAPSGRSNVENLRGILLKGLRAEHVQNPRRVLLKGGSDVGTPSKLTKSC